MKTYYNLQHNHKKQFLSISYDYGYNHSWQFWHGVKVVKGLLLPKPGTPLSDCKTGTWDTLKVSR